MPTQSIILTPGTLPNPYCFTDWQRLNVDIVTRIAAAITFNTGVGWNVGASTPTAEQRGLPWLNTANGRVYQWSAQYGLWISPMPSAEREAGHRRIWVPVGGQVESAVWSLDGGDGTDPSITAPTAVTGAAWQVDHLFDGRGSFGIGVIPSGGGSTVTTAIAGGAGQVALTSDNNGPHTHPPADPAEKYLMEIVGGGPSSATLAGTGLFPVEAQTGSSGLGTPHDNMPPYYPCYYLKPTAKIWYTIPG